MRDRPGSGESAYAELKRYVHFTEDDSRLLREARPLVAPHFPAIAQTFYDRTRNHEAAHAVFADEAQIARLQRSLVSWLERIFGGTHDDEFFAHTLRIGRVHALIELPQRYMLTAMSVVRGELVSLLAAAAPSARAAMERALHRVLDLELAGMLESYKQHTMDRLDALRSEAARALEQTEHRYVNAVEAASVLIVGLGDDMTIRFSNRETERVTGRLRAELLGLPFGEVLDDASSVTALARAVAEDEAPSGTGADGVVRTRAGKLRDVHWRFSRASAEAQDVTLIAIGNDVTEERLQSERFQKEQKLAAVGTLAAGLAHEIRNPLNGAQLHVAFLERNLKKRPELVDELDAVLVIGDEIKRLARLVSEFLDFARPRPLALAEVSVGALTRRVEQLVTAKAMAAGAELRVDVPPDDFTFAADAGKLEQVLINLLHNACEAVEPQGGGVVTLRVRRKPREVLFEVEDDGPGLQRPDAPIFDAFFSTKAQGTGLGLSISHRIVSDHGGALTVETQPGRTIFRFAVPLKAA